MVRKEEIFMNQKERMLSGHLYESSDAGLSRLRKKAHDLCRTYNTLSEDDPKRNEILKDLIPDVGKDVYLQGPIQFDYGIFTSIGERTYANFNFLVLDCAPVKIGKDVFIGPNVSILPPMHHLRYQERNSFYKEDGAMSDKEYAKPVEIGDNCWIAGNVTICGGVKIGSGSVIGAGSVVTRDIPENTLAAGVPCKPIRKISEKDSLKGSWREED